MGQKLIDFAEVDLGDLIHIAVCGRKECEEDCVPDEVIKLKGDWQSNKKICPGFIIIDSIDAQIEDAGIQLMLEELKKWAVL